jgi:outer membrane biosynthesis protein TonB
MSHYSLFRLKNFPAVDTKQILKLSKGEYSEDEQIYFTRENKDKLKTQEFLEPKLLSFSLADLSQLEKIGPKINYQDKFEKIKYPSSKFVLKLYANSKSDFTKSIGLHVFSLLFLFSLSLFSFSHKTEPQIVEISFGLSDQISNSQQDVSSKDPEGQREATKTIEDLPQLTKNAAPDVGPKQSDDQNKSQTTKPNDLVFNDPKKLASPEKAEKNDTKNKNIGPKIPTNTQKIKEEEFLKRKEEDLRKVANEKQNGLHIVDTTKSNGVKHSVNSLPKSPFQSVNSIPQAPQSLAPMGDERGTTLSSRNAYEQYLRRQLRLNWNASQGSTFPKNIKTIVNFQINPFGYLIGKPQIKVSSGNKDFDNMALDAVQASFPVTTPPPKDIQPPQFNAIYRPNDVD